MKIIQKIKLKKTVFKTYAKYVSGNLTPDGGQLIKIFDARTKQNEMQLKCKECFCGVNSNTKKK